MSYNVSAQESTEVYLDGTAVRDVQLEKPSFSNLDLQKKLDAMMAQKGNNSEANGVPYAIPGVKNYTTIYQEGNNNNVYVEQVGTGNYIDSYLHGNDNDMSMRQIGDDNTIIQDFQSLNGANVDVQQFGNANSLQLDETAVNIYDTKTIKVTQTGGMDVIIRKSTIIKK